MNSILISLELMPDQYHNQVIKTTKFGLFNVFTYIHNSDSMFLDNKIYSLP